MDPDLVRLQFVLEEKVSDAVTGVATVYGDNEHQVSGGDTYETMPDEPKDGSVILRRTRDGQLFKVYHSVTVAQS